jgi:hypothetical protein
MRNRKMLALNSKIASLVMTRLGLYRCILAASCWLKLWGLNAQAANSNN